MHVVRPEVLDALHLGCAEQRSVEGVCPSVILALERLTLAAPIGDGTRAVEANVIETAQRRPVAEYDDGIVAYLGGEVLPRLEHLVHSPNELPAVREDPLALELEIDRVVVEPSRDRRGASDVWVEGEY